jgi:hypothetical protein
MYPDFVVFRKQGAGNVCDILEPHSLSFEDSAAKAKGLAAFAKDCPARSRGARSWPAVRPGPAGRAQPERPI